MSWYLIFQYLSGKAAYADIGHDKIFYRWFADKYSHRNYSDAIQPYKTHPPYSLGLPLPPLRPANPVQPLGTTKT